MFSTAMGGFSMKCRGKRERVPVNWPPPSGPLSTGSTLSNYTAWTQYLYNTSTGPVSAEGVSTKIGSNYSITYVETDYGYDSMGRLKRTWSRREHYSRHLRRSAGW